MDRRDFLKLAACAGMSVCSPFPARSAPGGKELYDGPLFLTLRARGGWDQTMFMDPKGQVDPDNPVNQFPEDDIADIGRLRLAPFIVDRHRDFFEAHHDEMVVVHGYDVGVLAHASARRYTWTGTLRHTHPTIGALIAAARGPGMPLAYLTHGGTTPTAGVVDKVRASEMSTVREMTEYNTADVRGRPQYYEDYEQKMLEEAIKARMERRLDSHALPREKRDVARLQTVYAGQELIDKKASELPEANDLRDIDNPLERQATLAMASYQAGLTVCGSLYLDGFDSHDGNDGTQRTKLDTLVEGLSGIVDEAARRGIEDYYLIVMSDFGRSPGYNAGNGKGHYPIASMMVISPNVDGNRVVGETSQRLEPQPVDPDSLEVDTEGIQLRPEHVHESLRRLAGIADHPLCQEKYPLQQDPTAPLFPEV